MAEHEICPECAKLNTFVYTFGKAQFLTYVKCSECGHVMFSDEVPKVQQNVP